MGKVIRHEWPEQDHARAPTGSLDAISASACNVTPLTPLASAKATSGNQWAEGIPRRRQRETVGRAKDRADATAVVPPRELMTESGVIMGGNVVCTPQTCQEFAISETTFGAGYGAIAVMIDPNHVIFGRLDSLRKELGIKTHSEFATEIGLDKSTYSLIKNLKRELSFETACRIREKYHVTLDWIFYGDLRQSADRIMARIGRGPAAELPESQPDRPRKRA